MVSFPGAPRAEPAADMRRCAMKGSRSKLLTQEGQGPEKLWSLWTGSPRWGLEELGFSR